MASEVSICNLALSHIGAPANISSLDETTYEAELCAQFYPIARDALLEMHPWNFATERVELALLEATVSQWAYAYAMPSGVSQVLSILPPESTDDYSAGSIYFETNSPDGYIIRNDYAYGYYTPQPYAIEMIDGQQVILTNQENAWMRYSTKQEGTTKYSPLFVIALSHYLASMIAGPLIKNDAGAAQAKAQMTLMMTALSQAKQSDSMQRSIKPRHVVPWIASR